MRSIARCVILLTSLRLRDIIDMSEVEGFVS